MDSALTTLRAAECSQMQISIGHPVRSNMSAVYYVFLFVQHDCGGKAFCCATFDTHGQHAELMRLRTPDDLPGEVVAIMRSEVERCAIEGQLAEALGY